MADEKSFKTIIIEALNFHNRAVKDYSNQVADWKERFEILQKQKHKYQEEYRNIKKEVETCSQENNKLKGEVDSLRKIVNRDHRSEKCAACSSFQHTIQTLKDVYENTLTQKDSHISYLENRIRELEKCKKDYKKQHTDDVEPVKSDISLRSPDSTCKFTPNKTPASKKPKVNSFVEEQGTVDHKSKDKFVDEQEDGILFHPSPEKTDKSLKLRIPRNKKRSRYSEDPSPENKRLRFDNVNTTHGSGQGQSCREPVQKNISKGKTNNKPHIIVPETCDFDADVIDDNDDIVENKTCVETENGGHKSAVPCIVKTNVSLKVDEINRRKNTRKVTVENNSSSDNDEENSVKGQKQKGVNRSWLHSILKSPECENEIESSEHASGKSDQSCNSQSNDTKQKIMSMRKTVSDPGYMLQQRYSSGDNMSQNDTLLDVIPLKKHKINTTNIDADEEGDRFVISDNLILKPTELSTSKDSSLSSSGAFIENVAGTTVHQPIDIPSDSESPLILRSSGRIGAEKRVFPEVDALFEDSDESPTGKSTSKNDSVSKITRKVKGQKRRSQESLNSPNLKDTSKLTAGKKILGTTDENKQDAENKLRQTTLSQAFMNGTKQDSDLQLAIEQSLRETSKQYSETKSKLGQELIDVKENSPPFKRPAIPKLSVKKVRHPSINDLDETVAPLPKSKHLPDLDLDATIAPARTCSETKENNYNHDLVNGSLDPAIQLSQLCGESQELDDETCVMLKNIADKKSMHQTDLESLDTLEDFRLEDLRGNPGMPKTSTCVELDDSQGIPCSSTSVKFGSGRYKRGKRKLNTGVTEDVENEDKQKNKQIMEDSFDVRPQKPEPEYAYVDVVRGKEDRRKLKAFWCQECADYYKDTGLTDVEIQKKMQNCSRHRATFVPPSTPEHFWSVDFMDTPECEERGYINKENSEDKKKPVFKRKQGYRQLFKSKKDNFDE